MKSKGKAVWQYFFYHEKRVFFASSILFGILFSYIHVFCDDIAGMRIESGTLADYWERAVDACSWWSSRVLVNFVLLIFVDNSQFFLFGALMGLSLFILLYSFSELFTPAEGRYKRQCNLVITCLVLLFPFQYFKSAGWIATMTTYLTPTAFGFFSLIPIRKTLYNRKIKWWEYLLYSAALIYGANNEQMMVVILGCYGVCTMYFLMSKKVKPYLLVQLLLSVASCLNVMLCPGNFARAKSEIRWYKNWRMFDRIDKVDLGYSTTMQWLLLGSNAFLIVICLLFAYLLWKKYRNIRLAATAGIPAAFTILFGPLRTITLTLFPSISLFTDGIERNGLVTVVNRGDFKAFSTYFIWMITLMLLCMAVILLQDSMIMLIASMSMLLFGAASRMVMGFSPTIYASAERTFTIMVFCVIGVACLAYSNSVERGYLDNRSLKAIGSIAAILIMISFISIMFMVSYPL